MTELFPLLHFGALHTYEKALVALIALGPFIIMIVVVMIVRRRDADTEDADTPTESGSSADRS
jgi:hypothetical protein